MSTELTLLVDMKYLELGLIPYSMQNEEDDSIDKILSQMTPEDRRKITRKFRRESRKAFRKNELKRWDKVDKMSRRIRLFNRVWLELDALPDIDNLI